MVPRLLDWPVMYFNFLYIARCSSILINFLKWVAFLTFPFSANASARSSRYDVLALLTCCCFNSLYSWNASSKIDSSFCIGSSLAFKRALFDLFFSSVLLLIFVPFLCNMHALM